jgi:vacuolar-type H+-ATPase subunit H
MEARLSTLFEFQIDKVQKEMSEKIEKQRAESEKQRAEMEKKMNEKMEEQREESEKKMRKVMEKITSEMEKEIESLRSTVTELKSDNTQLKLDNARLLTDLTEVHTDLRILHPLPYARLHLQKCINHQIAFNDAVNAYISLHTLPVINSTPSLTLRLQALKRELKKAWDARFSAAFLCEPPPTLDKVLWIVAKNGYTKEVMRCMNLNQATRSCKMLQKVMREVKGKYGMTQLNYFACKGMISSVNRMLLMKGIDVESRDVYGDTPLTNAAAYGIIEIVEMLLNHGARIEGKDDDGCTSLHAASSRGHLSAVNLLINKGANFEVSSVHGWKSLHTAASNGHLKIVKALIAKGADMNSLTKGGQSALGWARRKNRHKIVDFLRTRGAIDDGN